MQTITVNTPSKSYPVFIGDGMLESCGRLAAEIIGVGTAAVVTDDTVDALYAERLIKVLEHAGFRTVKYVFPHGEQSKNAETYLNLLEFLSEHRLARNDAVFALGGGVVGDLTGFAAATYLRGIRFVQIPTTLLAAVDSSVGGKTAINLSAGKNLAGAFYQPDLVVCDPTLLSTLPKQIFSDGCAEVIKYAVLCDKPLFELLKEPIASQLGEIIARCVTIKSEIVAADEHDTGKRQLLNLGHTFGHAVEKCSGYAVSHGSAVAIGMVLAARAAANLGVSKTDLSAEIAKLLCHYDLPDTTDCNEDALFDALISDKKRLGEAITFVFPETIGNCILKKIPVDEAKRLLHDALKGGETP